MVRLDLVACVMWALSFVNFIGLFSAGSRLMTDVRVAGLGLGRKTSVVVWHVCYFIDYVGDEQDCF